MNTPKLEVINGGFYLTEKFRYTFRNRKYVVVPSGYRTNFASIPAVGRWLISPIDPQITVAALVHDWLTNEFDPINYANYDKVICTGEQPTVLMDVVSWEQAVAILRQIMLEDGAPLWKRQVVYLSVRAYGIIKRK